MIRGTSEMHCKVGDKKERKGKKLIPHVLISFNCIFTHEIHAENARAGGTLPTSTALGTTRAIVMFVTN